MLTQGLGDIAWGEVASGYATPDRPRWVVGSIGPGTKLPSLGHPPFAVLRDGTGICQCVFVKSQVAPEVWARFAELTTETSVEITGEARAEARAPGGRRKRLASGQAAAALM